MASISYVSGGRKRSAEEEAEAALSSQRPFEWEKHSNAIASSIMKNLGYERGKGLGKSKQGISSPVEVKVRLGKGAIGYYGTERTERSLNDFPVKDEEAEEETKFKEQMNQWKRTDTSKKKTQYIYKTADELIAKGIKRKDKGQGPKVKVIDMTGKESRVLSGYHAISKSFDVPELLHNLNLLVDMTAEILEKEKELKRVRELLDDNDRML